MSARHSSRLDARRRAEDLATLADGQTVDVLVVGGGITGVGVALDAASRGLSVALLEREDLASGTSRWSSKLAHGGLRYLAQGDVGVAWESAAERAILVDRTAPHLVRALPQVMALHEGVSATSGGLYEVGIRLGDGLRMAARTSGRRLPRARRISAAEALRWVPALDAHTLRGALLSWDGQLEDDARLVVALARTAAAHGARILTHAPVVALHGRRCRGPGRPHRSDLPRPRPSRRQRHRRLGRGARARGEATSEQGLAPALRRRAPR